MMNKRDFLKGGATAIAATAGTTSTLAATRPSLSEQAGLASWRAHVGEHFDVQGHAVVLKAVTRRPSHQPGEQFSLSFEGRLPADLGDQLLVLSAPSGEPVSLYLARTPLGLRADFCRLQG